MKKIILLAFLILFLVTGTNLYSQGPHPTPLENSHYKQSTPKKTNGNGNPNIAESTKITSDKQRQGINKSSSCKNFIEILIIILNSLATISIAIFTGLLWRSNKNLFITTHRPRLRVHSIYLEKLSIPPKIVNGSYKTHRLNYSVDNIGGSPATIIKKSLTFKRINQPLAVPLYAVPLLIKKTIACGESVIESIDVEDALICASSDSVYNDLHFFGYIDFLDNIGTTRRTAFCRQYIKETKRFIKVEDEDYEYSY